MKHLKSIRNILFLLGFVLLITECGKKEITYKGGMGFSATDLPYKEVKFHIYRSNTDNHKWKRIHTFNISLQEIKKDEYIDINLSSKNKEIIAQVTKNSVTKDETSKTIESKVINSTKFDVPGFTSNLTSYERKSIIQSDQEQIFLLYPISHKSSATYFSKISLSEPYDIEKRNLDNILVTVEFMKP